MTAEACKYTFHGLHPSGFNAKDFLLYETLKEKLPVEVCIHSPPKRYTRQRYIGKKIVVYLDRLVVHDWR